MADVLRLVCGMLTTVLTVVSLMTLGAEFYFGVAVVGWQGDDIVVDRRKAPGPYWAWMTLHTTIGIGLPVLLWFARV